MSLARVSPVAYVGESGDPGPRYALSLASWSELAVNSCSSNSYLKRADNAHFVSDTTFHSFGPAVRASDGRIRVDVATWIFTNSVGASSRSPAEFLQELHRYRGRCRRRRRPAGAGGWNRLRDRHHQYS